MVSQAHVRATLFLGMIASLSAPLGCSNNATFTPPSTAANTIEKVAEKGPVTMTIRVSPSEPQLSELVEMEIMVVAREKIEIEPPAFGQAVGDFLVRDYSERKTDMFGKLVPSNSRLFRYRLEPMHSGPHLIRSLPVSFIDNRPESEGFGSTATIESEPIEVTIRSELGDTVPDLANLEPMAAPKSIDSNFPWLWFGVATVLVAFVAIAFWLTRSKKGQSIASPIRTPSEIANEQLALLLAEDLPGRGLFKDFYLRLTGVVRNYIEGTTGLRAPEQTTEEFLRESRTTDYFSAEQSLRLKDFLEAADMVKYAGQQPDLDQIETSILRAREFIGLKLAPQVVSVQAITVGEDA